MHNRHFDVVALVLAAGIAWGCGFAPTRASEEHEASGSASTGDASAALRDLEGLEELREAFNQDAGHPRLVLLLSPT